jgi:hypothetical protein
VLDAVGFLRQKEDILRTKRQVMFHPFIEKGDRERSLYQLKREIERLESEFDHGKSFDSQD